MFSPSSLIHFSSPQYYRSLILPHRCYFFLLLTSSHPSMLSHSRQPYLLPVPSLRPSQYPPHSLLHLPFIIWITSFKLYLNLFLQVICHPKFATFLSHYNFTPLITLFRTLHFTPLHFCIILRRKTPPLTFVSSQLSPSVLLCSSSVPILS